ncbi:hypothetical protein ACU686_27125 [Yinghuangia aomiensis]
MVRADRAHPSPSSAAPRSGTAPWISARGHPAAVDQITDQDLHHTDRQPHQARRPRRRGLRGLRHSRRTSSCSGCSPARVAVFRERLDGSSPA